jgi:hypothetical protein
MIQSRSVGSSIHILTKPGIAMLNTVDICEAKIDEFRKMFRNPVESFYKSKICNALESGLMIKTPRVSSLADYIQIPKREHI